MKVLELFGGTRSIGKAFEEKGHEVFSVEWDKNFEGIDLYEDILNVNVDDIIKRFGRPDVIWASPDCSSYSIAAISHHRKQDENGNLAPVSDYAKFCDRVNQHVLCLILALSPKYWFIENPRGGVTQNGFYERASAVYDNLLSIWGYTDETDRHLDESS
jgi:site-specific DNA-cytosine methylase